MPRRERPLERTEDELSRFAADLRALRAQVGTPSYRELGRRAHYSSSTLSDAAGGRKLPTLPVTLAYVRACGGDVEVWARRWRELAAELPDGTEPDAGSPYAGLAAFQTADADRFFGRDRLVEDLLDRLSRRPLVAVFGPSGAGKSSLLRAGLIPRLTGEHVVFTPGAHPLKTYEEHVAGHPPADLVVVVDQFEECFTLCADPAERDAFLSALVRSATGRTRVVLGVRADFYEHCAFHEKLAEAVTDAQVLLGPMHADELREAIVRPAAAVGCVVDTALVTRLVAETAGQPAALPLLSHALLETWRRRSGMRLTLEGYERTGGIEHALARTAEETYESLTGAQQETVRHLCRRLATAEIGAPAVKRRVARDELGDDATEVLDQLAAARLVSLDRDSVELAHEALLRHWPRLRDWLAEDSEGLQLHRRLTRAAVDWVAFDRDPGILYRGARLDDALAWRAENDATLNAVEREFLDAATELRDQERTLDRRRASRRRLVTTVLVALVVLAAAATAYGVSARQQAAEQAALATSQRMVSQGRGFLITDSTEAARLALAAYRIAPTDDARDLVLSAAAGSDRTDFAGAVGTVGDVTLSTDGRLIAFGGAKAVQLWDLPHYRKLATIPGALGTLTLSEDGRWLTVSRPQRTVELYDLDDPTAPALAATFPAAETARIDPTGTVLATRAPGQPTRLLSIDHGVAPREFAALPPTEFVSFSASGRTVFIGQQEGPTASIHVWEYDTTGARHLTKWTGIGTVVFGSAHGLTVTLDTYGDEQLRLWDTTNLLEPRELPPLPLPPSGFQQAVFDAEARTLAVTDRSATIRVIDVSDPRNPRLEASLAGHTAPIKAMTFLPGRRLLSAGLDATARPWELNFEEVSSHVRR